MGQLSPSHSRRKVCVYTPPPPPPPQQKIVYISKHEKGVTIYNSCKWLYLICNMPKAMNKSSWCLIISHTKIWGGLGCGSGIINVYMFLCPAIYKGLLACFYICVFLNEAGHLYN